MPLRRSRPYRARPTAPSAGMVESFAELLGIAFFQSDYCRCPNCGTERLRPLRKVDGIDRVSRSPWNYVQRFLGGKLYNCVYCRLQFYDRRPLGVSVDGPLMSTARSPVPSLNATPKP